MHIHNELHALSHFSPICFGAYNFSVCSKILLNFVIAYACIFVYNYLKKKCRLEMKSTTDHVPTSFLNTSHLMWNLVGFFHSVTLLVRFCPSVAYKWSVFDVILTVHRR